MRVPAIGCKIKVTCPVNLSEDPEKVEHAVSNVFPFSEITHENFSIIGQSRELRSLEKIYETISSTRSYKTYARNLENNLDGNTTWFFLNKQAAFVEKIAICDEAEESPLGPIKIILSSSNIDGIIDWIAFPSDVD